MPRLSDVLSARELAVLGDMIEASYDVRTPAHFLSLFQNLRTLFNFEYSACGIIDLHLLHFEVSYSDYPLEFVNLYLVKGMSTEPSLVRIRTLKHGLATSEDEPPPPREVVDAIKDQFGIQNCLSVAVKGTVELCFYMAFSNVPELERAKLLAGLRLVGSALHLSCMRAIAPGETEIVNEVVDVPTMIRSFTSREIEILKWMFEGKTAGEMAIILGIAERTVRFHMESIAQKSGMNPRQWDARTRWRVTQALALRGYHVGRELLSEAGSTLT